MIRAHPVEVVTVLTALALSVAAIESVMDDGPQRSAPLVVAAPATQTSSSSPSDGETVLAGRTPVATRSPSAEPSTSAEAPSDDAGLEETDHVPNHPRPSATVAPPAPRPATVRAGQPLATSVHTFAPTPSTTATTVVVTTTATTTLGPTASVGASPTATAPETSTTSEPTETAPPTSPETSRVTVPEPGPTTGTSLETQVARDG